MAGRYTSTDPIGLEGGWNRFGYAYQDGVNYFDKSGLCVGPFAVACVWAAVEAPWILSSATAASSIAYAYINGGMGVAATVPSAVSRMTPAARAAEEFALSCKSIATPYGIATQGQTAATLAARGEVSNGATLYRIGTIGKSQAAEAQFWSLEHPLSIGYANRYGIPAGNVLNANFIEAATLNSGTPFITRAAPGIGGNIGGGIEVVVPSGGVQMKWFTGMP